MHSATKNLILHIFAPVIMSLIVHLLQVNEQTSGMVGSGYVQHFDINIKIVGIEVDKMQEFPDEFHAPTVIS